MKRNQESNFASWPVDQAPWWKGTSLLMMRLCEENIQVQVSAVGAAVRGVSSRRQEKEVQLPPWIKGETTSLLLLVFEFRRSAIRFYS